MSSLKSIAQQAVVNAGLESHLPTSQQQTISEKEISEPVPVTLTVQSKVLNTHTLQATTEAHVPPLLGVQPLGPIPLTKECYYQLGMLEAAYHHLPHPSDSERLRALKLSISPPRL